MLFCCLVFFSSLFIVKFQTQKSKTCKHEDDDVIVTSPSNIRNDTVKVKMLKFIYDHDFYHDIVTRSPLDHTVFQVEDFTLSPTVVTDFTKCLHLC